jgi:hypothetical protein
MYCGVLASSDSAAMRTPAPQRPHLRFGSLQASNSRPSTTDPTHHARTGPLQADPPPSTTHHTQTRTAAHAKARAIAKSPGPHVLSRLSVVRLGGSVRASASTPASPIWLSASRVQPSHNNRPNAIRALQADPPQKGRTPALRTTRDPALQRMPKPRAIAKRPGPHVLSRLSVVRLGGSARASASTPASPIWLSARREQRTVCSLGARIWKRARNTFYIDRFQS